MVFQSFLEGLSDDSPFYFNTMSFKLLDKSWADNLALLDTYFGAEAWNRLQFLAEFDSNCSQILGIVEGAELRGYMALRSVADEAEILKVFISEPWRRSGLGSDLMKAATEVLLANGIRVIHLEVRESNLSAREFYQSQGFVNSGRRKNYYKNPAEDAILMHRMLIK